MLSAVVFYLVCTAGQCERFEPAAWVEPTAAEVDECQRWAAKLVGIGQTAGCELTPKP